MHIVFVGPPGAGKGTQAEKVAAQLGLAHIAPGDLFRKAVTRGDELGSAVKSYMEKGELVPNDITVRVILESLVNLNGAVLLDGFPRNLNQALALDEALSRQHSAIDHVIYIQVDQPELVKRLSSRWLCRECQSPHSIREVNTAELLKCISCGGELYQRPDDNPETVNRRLQVYFEETAPLIDYYEQQGKLIHVSGEGEVDTVKERIIRALGIKGGDNNKI